MYIHARNQAWETPPFRGLWTKKCPHFNRKGLFWGPTKHSSLKQNMILFSLHKIMHSFLWKRDYLYQTFFLCTSYLSLRLFFKISWISAWKKLPLFVDFANLCLPLKKYHFSWKWIRAWMSVLGSKHPIPTQPFSSTLRGPNICSFNQYGSSRKLKIWNIHT